MISQNQRYLALAAVVIVTSAVVVWAKKESDKKQALQIRQVMAVIHEEHPYLVQYVRPLIIDDPGFIARSSQRQIVNRVSTQISLQLKEKPLQAWSNGDFLRNLERHFQLTGVAHKICSDSGITPKPPHCISKGRIFDRLFAKKGLVGGSSWKADGSGFWAQGVDTKNQWWAGSRLVITEDTDKYEALSRQAWVSSYGYNRVIPIWSQRPTETVGLGSGNSPLDTLIRKYQRNSNDTSVNSTGTKKSIASESWISEFNRRELGEYYTVESSGPYSSTVLKERKKRTLTVCNFAPYTVTSTLALPVVPQNIILASTVNNPPYFTEGGARKLSGWHHSEPGECKEIYIGRYAESPKGVGIYSERNGGMTELRNYLGSLDTYDTYWGGEKQSWGGSDYFACVSSEVLSRVVDRSENECPEGAYLANYYNVDLPEDGGTYTWNVLDDGVCNGSPNVDCDSLNLELAAGYARALSRSLERQSAVYSWWSGGPSPYLLGVSTNDTNGPFEPGVKVKALINGSVTPFGNAIQVKPGDSIVSLNGFPVYSVKDMHYALYQFGQNRVSGGVNKVFGYKVRRGDSYYYLEGTYYFNPNYPWSGDICDASWKGLVSSATIGMDAEALCVGSNVLTGAANFLSAFAADISGTENYDSYEYLDTAECIFNAKQEKWMLKQFCPVQYENAAFFGLFVSAPRAIAQGVLKKQIPKIVSSKGTARVFRDIMIETSEAAAWAYMDMPVGATRAETFSEIKKAAKLGGAVGLATALVGGSKKK